LNHIVFSSPGSINWHNVGDEFIEPKKAIMKETINVIVIDDNEYFNSLLSNALQQSVSSILFKGRHQLVMRSFTNGDEYIRKLNSGELKCNDTVVFIDYYLGDSLNASHIVKLLRENSCEIMIVLMSQSKEVREKVELPNYDYFVVKDKFAPALCCLYLKQFIENKFSVSID